jgi:CAAX prenyl protease-like protein
MISLLAPVRRSSLLARVVPFAVFAVLTAFQGKLGDASPYWLYAVKTFLGAWLLWAVWPVVSEMRWRGSVEAVVVGVGVFVFWVGLDAWYPKLGSSGATWDPFAAFSNASGLAWALVVIRVLGSTLVVPPLEEVFYRSFLYRYLRRADFEALPLAGFHPLAFLATSAAFGLTHHQWLAGILCGFAYQGLVCWKGRLGDAMTAHAITNLLLGLWVVAKGAWQFW